MADFLNSYAGLPTELLSAAANAGKAKAVSGCNADEWDCSTDNTCSSDGVCKTDRSCSTDCSADTSGGCNSDSWDCSTDGACNSDGVCRTDGCRSDSCSSDGVCDDTSTVAKPTESGVLVVEETTSTSITIHMSPITRAEYYEIAYRLPSTTEATYEISDSRYYTIEGLEPNTTYIINYRGVNSGGDGPFMSTGVTAKTKPEAEPFDWTYAGLNISGTPVFGDTKQDGYGIYVTADEWNELAESVSNVTSKSVRMVLSGTEISAEIVNTMANSLKVKTVNPEDTITASFFNALRDAYNALL